MAESVDPPLGDYSRVMSDSAFFAAAGAAVFAIATAIANAPAGAIAGFARIAEDTETRGRLVVGEHFLDPDFVSFRSLKERADTAGFILERRSGTSLVYFARFRPTQPEHLHLQNIGRNRCVESC
jgi:hypothetical protein